MKSLDKVFETLPVGKKISRTDVDLLAQILKKTELDISPNPKKLTLSDVNEENLDEIVEDMLKNVGEKLNFHIYEQDLEVIEDFNRKVKRIKSELENLLTGSPCKISTSSKSKKGSFGAFGMENENMFSLKDELSSKHDLLLDFESNKENLPVNPMKKTGLAQNRVDKISLECEEKIKLFGGFDESQQDANIFDNLECSDELLPPREENGPEQLKTFLRDDESDSMIVGEEDRQEYSDDMIDFN